MLVLGGKLELYGPMSAARLGLPSLLFRPEINCDCTGCLSPPPDFRDA